MSDAPRFSRRTPPGDEMERAVCDACGFVDYENPKIVVGSVVTDARGRILLCRRAIEPGHGLWTLPAGYLELGESPAEGAVREAWEEARARIEIVGVLGLYTIRRLSQVQIMHRARLVDPAIAPGPESLEVRLFPPDALPMSEIAFPSVHWALEDAGPFDGGKAPAVRDG